MISDINRKKIILELGSKNLSTYWLKYFEYEGSIKTLKLVNSVN